MDDLREVDERLEAAGDIKDMSGLSENTRCGVKDRSRETVG